MMMTQEAVVGNLTQLIELTEGLQAFVRQAAEEGTAAHEVEREVWQRVLAMGRQAMGQFFHAQGDGDVGNSIEMPDGQQWQRLDELHRRMYQSIFGAFELQRAVYGTREGQKIEFVPLDARLELPQSEFSYVLQDWAQSLDVDHAFARTAETLQMIFGLSVSVDSLEQMNRKMAESVEGFRTSLPKPAAKAEGEILVTTADGKGIPMRRPSDGPPAGARRKKGEKANKKQMATIGCVYTVDRKVRTAEEVVGALFRERPAQDKRKASEPMAQQKRVWSSLSYQQGPQHVEAEPTVFGWMAREVASRRRPGQEVVCVMDGQRSLWTACKKYLPGEDVVEVLDLLHVTSRLWEAAYLFHAEGSDEAADFVRNRLLRILRGEAGYVVGGLRQMGTKHRLRASKRAKLTTICNYFKHNQHRMRYDDYLRKGYPIASGVIEGACRHVIKDRMERAGMRWIVEGAQAMLDLRSTYINGQWSDFQAYRIHRERQRLYPQRGVLQHFTWSLAT